MTDAKPKPLSSLIFFPLLSLIFLRPFFSGLAYPTLEIYYENIVIFLGAIALLTHKRRAGLNLPYAYGGAISLLLIAYIFSTITSINIQNSIKETIKLISYISVFFLVSQANIKQKQTLIKTIVIAASIISLYSIYQYFWGYQHTLDYLRRTNNDFLLNSSYARDILIAKRAIGTFPSPNILGSYLIMAFFLSLSLAKKYLAPVLIAIALLLTKSMGAWLSLILALIALFILSYRSVKKQRLMLGLSLIFIALAITFILVTRWERLMDIDNPQNSITQRLSYWRTAIAVIKDNPLFGVGPGNFQEVFLKYKVGLSTDARYAHNLFLHIWAEMGMLGIMALSYLILSFIRKPRIRPENKFIFLSGLAFLLHNLIDNTYFIPETGIFLWVLFGLTTYSLCSDREAITPEMIQNRANGLCQ
ncbi:MAG: O-antigen ligase family protein [Candidatus Orphnella occulta]|nr:O-antigen ligase family protein [Candidatus Orphnella occulta]